MRKETLLRMLKLQVQKLLGKVATYDKSQDKVSWFSEVEVIEKDIRELLTELKNAEQ